MEKSSRSFCCWRERRWLRRRPSARERGLVEVDAIVRDGHGPVAGLTNDDFTILDNGKPQKIAAFSVRSARNPKAKVAPLPAGIVSNRVNRLGETPASATIC